MHIFLPLYFITLDWIQWRIADCSVFIVLLAVPEQKYIAMDVIMRQSYKNIDSIS